LELGLNMELINIATYFILRIVLFVKSWVHDDGTKLRGCVWRNTGLVFESPLCILRCTQLSSGVPLEWKFKAIPMQFWTGPEGCSRLRLPELLDIRHMKVARLSALRTGRIYSWGDRLLLVSISVRSWVDPRAKVRCAISIPKSLDGTHDLRLPLIAMIQHYLICTIVQYVAKQWFVAWWDSISVYFDMRDLCRQF
jgi:hypothetical protein